MRQKIQKKMFEFCYLLELLISCVIGIAVVILGVRLFLEMINLSVFSGGDKILETILDKAMILAIGVEFIKMLCRHTSETVVEVLLFAIARQLVLVHKSALDILIEVAAIAALFAIRKYLLTKRDERESVGDTGKSKLNFFKKEEEENKKVDIL